MRCRAEHWTVVKGTALVINGDSKILLSENESTFIPIGAMHGLENSGVIPLELIEKFNRAVLSAKMASCGLKIDMGETMGAAEQSKK